MNKTTMRMIVALLTAILGCRRHSHLHIELLSKRINNLETLVGMLASAVVEGGCHNPDAFREIIGFTTSGVGEGVHRVISLEIADLDRLEGMIEDLSNLTDQQKEEG